MDDDSSTRAMLIGEYLRARRSMVDPEDVGLPADPRRRVRGLRREEVAALAAISREYYVRLEQGRGHMISPQVQAALGRALALDHNARSYLRRLIDPSSSANDVGFSFTQIGDSVVKLLEQWSDTPAILFDRNHDILFVNDLAALMSPGYTKVGNNMVLSIFSASEVNRRDPRWRETARDAVASLRFAGDPSDRRYQQLVGDLCSRDMDFSEMWAEHEARPLTHGVAPNYIDGFGWVEIAWQVLEIPGGNFLHLTVTDPETAAGAAIRFLASSLRRESSDVLPATAEPTPLASDPIRANER